MAVPKYYEFYGAFLKELADGNVHAYKDLKPNIAQRLNLSAEDLAEEVSSGGQTVYDNRVGWARTYLKKAGLIESPTRGQFKLTDAGKAALPDADNIDNTYLTRYDSFRSFVNRENTDSPSTDAVEAPDEKTPDEILADAFKAVSASLEDDLMRAIMELSPTDFEKLVMKLLRKMGYGSGLDKGYKVTQASNDGGIDGYIEEDPLGCSSICYQAKQWDPSRTVDRPEIQKFAGAMNEQHKASKGLFITTAKFSAGAKASAESAGIVLVDGDMITKLMINYKLGVSVVRTYEVMNIDTDFFNDEF